MKATIKKICIILLMIGFVLSPSLSHAETTDVNVTSPTPGEAANEGMASIFETFGVSSTAMKKKETAPQVSLIFTPTNPEEGQKISATAIPSYFMNDTKKLYFTWYLKSKECYEINCNAVKCSEKDKEMLKKCDLNTDNKVDINDYEIKAMRIIANNDFSWEGADYSVTADGKSSYKAVFGGDDQRGKNAYCYVQSVSSGDNYPIECNTHMFPDAPHEVTGDGSFGRDEEKFWHTDPTSADTAQTGNVDEANLAGLGVNTFTWTYKSGDRIGVAVEGIAINTSGSEDSAFRTMWAAPNGMCYKKEIGEGSIPNVSALKECLYDSLVSPSENSASSQKIDVTLSYLPNSPINDPGQYSDPSLSNGDELVIQSSVSNANDSNYLQYSWQVFFGDEPVPDSWGEPIAKADLPGSTQMEGLGLSTFKFKLNLRNPKNYIDVKLTVKESSSSGEAREGHSDIVIPLNSNGDTISAFSTTTSEDPTNPQISMTDEICTNSIENAICPVAKGSIIGLSASSQNLQDFLWTIDGKAISYPTCFFEGCDPAKPTSIAYFPVLKEVGNQYTVNLTAIDPETGERMNLSRTFQVINPAISITSIDESACKPVQLGNHLDTSGNQWADYSQSSFWGKSNTPIKLKVVANGFTLDPENYTWLVNGATYDTNEEGTLTLPGIEAGGSYSVSVSSTYAQDLPTIAALNKYWGVSYSQIYEDNLSSNITIKIQDGAPQTSAAKTKKFMATIYTSLPAYFAFLLRIVLTIFLILFVSQLVLTFFPEIKTEE